MHKHANHGSRCLLMVTVVLHSQRWGIQQSANVLHNRSTLLKLEKKIFIIIIFTIMCTTHQQQWCVCKPGCPQPRMDCLRRFQCNCSVLWTYCHHPVARFLRQWLGRQSKFGWHGGDLEGLTMVIWHCPCAHSAHWTNLPILPITYRSHQCCWWEGARVLVER